MKVCDSETKNKTETTVMECQKRKHELNLKTMRSCISKVG
jgi:hypothetical protein